MRDFPDYRIDRFFEAAIEVFRMRISATVLQRQTFPIIGQFMLRAIELGYQTTDQVAYLLGVEARDLAGAGALLLSSELLTGGGVSSDGEREYCLTPAGVAALKGNREIATPKRANIDLHYSVLTGHLLPRETAPVRAGKVRDSGIFVIRKPGGHVPSLDDITVRDVRAALAAGLDSPNLDILQILDITDPYEEYIRGIYVFYLRHRHTAQVRLVAYRGLHFLPVESEALDQMNASGKFQLPGDAAVLTDTDWVESAVLPELSRGSVSTALEAAHRVQEIELNLLAQHSAHEEETDETQRLRYEGEIRRLVDELDQAQREREALTTRLQDIDGSELIVTEDHRRVLDMALTQAEREVLIVSPWMNLRAVDDDLIDLIRDAVQRGVSVRISYGIGNHRGDEENDRNRRSANAVRTRIRNRVGKHDGRLEIVEAGNTHEKILVCDEAFAVTGSFNWLSYRGELDKDYRRETSVLVRDPLTIQKIRERAFEALEKRASALAPSGRSVARRNP